MISPTIYEARSIDYVVEAVNAAGGGAVEYIGGTDLHTPEQLAGQYAYHSAVKESYTRDDAESEFEAHLNVLRDAGANFDVVRALQEALSILDELQVRPQGAVQI